VGNGFGKQQTRKTAIRLRAKIFASEKIKAMKG
jgi:hypothetical protein